MCCILQDINNITESGARLLRGAVFFIGMALWGSKKILSLKHPPSAVLPSFKQALHHSQSPIVAYEIVLSLQRLVNKYGKEQQMLTWDVILDILQLLLVNLENQASNQVLVAGVHDLLTAVEELYEQGSFNGSSERFFNLIETCAHQRPESSILVLVAYKSQSIQSSQTGWIVNLHHIMEKYFKQEKRTRIRLKVLDILATVLNTNKHLYEDEMLEVVVLPQLPHIEMDADLQVRIKAVQLLVDLSLSCQSIRCLDILGLLQKVSDITKIKTSECSNS